MPRDYGAKQTDKELAKLERRLSLLYGESKADLDEAVDNYYNGWTEDVWDAKNMEYKAVHHAGMKERYREEHQAFLDGKYHDPTGKYTDEEMFNRWVWAQEGRGKHIERMRDDMARAMTETNQRASAMINDTTPGIYSMNANWEAYKIEVVRKDDKGKWLTESARRDIEGHKIDVAFNIVREQTIKELATDKNHVEFRVNSVNPIRDYNWNKEQITRALTAGILQGESPYDVANRYMVVMQRNKTAAIRNARTSITSAQNAGCQNTYERATEMGIKLKKQWMSTRDARTRESHVFMNGKQADVDKEFENGLMYPGDVSGEPAEVYNCRCTMVTIDPAVSKVNGDPYNVKGFEEWMKQNRPELFEKVSEQTNTNGENGDKIKVNPQNVLSELLRKNGGIEYKEVTRHDRNYTESEIIEKLAGGDDTEGSCASVGLAYIGQKGGANVLDFRGGKSQDFFSSGFNLKKLLSLPNVKYELVNTYKSSVANAKRLLKKMEEGKEYYMVTGRHASIVRIGPEGRYQYLELQSAWRSGWTNFYRDAGETFRDRFGETKHDNYVGSYMIDVDSLKDSPELMDIIGYLNTDEGKQKKSEYGTIK